MSAPKVELYVNDMIYSGWESVSVKQSIKAISGSFDVSLTDQWDANGKPWPIIPGDDCILKIAGQTVIDGYIDDVDTEVSVSQKTTRISGRDATCDLVDCSAVYPSGHFSKPVSLVNLANILCKPYDITASINVTAAPLEYWSVNPSETVFNNLERAAKRAGVILIPDGSGGLLFTRAGLVNSGFKLEYGVNIESFSSKYSQKDRYSDYMVMAHPDMDMNSPSVYPPQVFRAKDPGTTRFRQLTIVTDACPTQIGVSHRAQWEATTRAGKSQPVTVSIVGFTKPNGKLWAINELASTVIPYLGINQDLLITDLTFSYSNQGSITHFQLMRKDGYLLLPEVDTKQEMWNMAVHSK